MTCIEKIYSVSALVGTGVCNANCNFCAGKPLRVKGDEAAYERNLEAAIKLSARSIINQIIYQLFLIGICLPELWSNR